jgi:hypothetical protein
MEAAENASWDMVNGRFGKIELKLAVLPHISFMVLLYFKMIDRRIQRKEQLMHSQMALTTFSPTVIVRLSPYRPAILCSLAGRYDNPIPPRFLAHICRLFKNSSSERGLGLG